MFLLLGLIRLNLIIRFELIYKIIIKFKSIDIVINKPILMKHFACDKSLIDLSW